MYLFGFYTFSVPKDTKGARETSPRPNQIQITVLQSFPAEPIFAEPEPTTGLVYIAIAKL